MASQGSRRSRSRKTSSRTNRSKRFLVVDDHVALRRAVETVLSRRGYTFSSAQNGKEAKELLAHNTYDMVITDLRMETKEAGIDVVRAALTRDPNIPVLVITGFADVESAVRAMKAGAYDFIEKPFSIDELENLIDAALQRTPRLPAESEPLHKDQDPFAGIIGGSDTQKRVFDTVERISDTDATVLITGETGTGKELIARAIHKSSRRDGKVFAPVNCGAIPENLLESELFGARKGAFTGAIDRAGRFQVAHKGTIFLDEIGDMPLHMQVKLLRVLQESEVQPVGADKPVSIDVRVVAATHQELEKSIADRSFRADLYYRLNVIHLALPALRERLSDLLPLAAFFIEKFNRVQRRNVVGLDVEAQKVLLAYPWPGNIRELENTMERVVILGREGLITLADLPAKFHRYADSAGFPEPATDVPAPPTQPFLLSSASALLARSTPSSRASTSDSRASSHAPLAVSSAVASSPSSATTARATPAPQSVPVTAPATPSTHARAADAPVLAREDLVFSLPEGGVDLRQLIENLEHQLIDQALELVEGNRAKAARLLGLNRTTLVERLKKRERKAKS